MKQIVLDELTKSQIEVFSESPGQVLILSGATGIGKLTLATQIAEAILRTDNFTNYAYGRIVSSGEDKTIGIDVVRGLEEFLSLKVPGSKSVDRVVIIEDAHKLTVEAQNALLKTLEEPPKGSLIILTVDNQQSLLPTINSRAATISVNKPDKLSVETFFSSYSNASFELAYAISNGLPGLLSSLLEQETHPLHEATEQARSLLSQTVYERLLSIDLLSKQRDLAIDTCYVLQQMAHLSLIKDSGASDKKWQQVLNVSYETAEALKNNVQPKLALLTLALNL